MRTYWLLGIAAVLLFCCGCTSEAPLVDRTSHTQIAGDVRDMQSDYDNLVISDPLNKTAWVLMGMYYNDAFGQYDKALESYNKALELDPAYGEAWLAKGITLQNMHFDDMAGTCFEMAVKYDPGLASRVRSLLENRSESGQIAIAVSRAE
jgi:superkiller protein 3